MKRVRGAGVRVTNMGEGRRMTLWRRSPLFSRHDSLCGKALREHVAWTPAVRNSCLVEPLGWKRAIAA